MLLVCVGGGGEGLQPCLENNSEKKFAFLYLYLYLLLYWTHAIKKTCFAGPGASGGHYFLAHSSRSPHGTLPPYSRGGRVFAGWSLGGGGWGSSQGFDNRFCKSANAAVKEALLAAARVALILTPAQPRCPSL